MLRASFSHQHYTAEAGRNWVPSSEPPLGGERVLRGLGLAGTDQQTQRSCVAYESGGHWQDIRKFLNRSQGDDCRLVFPGFSAAAEDFSVLNSQSPDEFAQKYGFFVLRLDQGQLQFWREEFYGDARKAGS